jgi:uncharacterized membrane protein
MTILIVLIIFIIGTYIGFRKKETINSFINRIKAMKDKNL